MAISEKRRAYLQKWRDLNRERLQRYHQAYRDTHQELKQYYSARYRRKKAEWQARKKTAEYKEKQRQYREANKDSIRFLNQQWRINNPVHAKEIEHRRRSRRKNAPVEHVSIAAIIQRDSSGCHLCLRFILPTEMSMDHLIPVARGGAFAEWNLMAAHLSCNIRRKDRQILAAESQECALAYIKCRNGKKLEAA